MRRARAALVAVAAAMSAFVAAVTWAFASRYDPGSIHDLAALVTVLSLVLSPTWYLLKILYDRHSARGMASANLYRDIEDKLKSLDRSRFHYDAISFVRKDNGRTVFYMNRIFNRDLYEGPARSGGLDFMATEHRQRVQDAYGRIKDHNDALDQIARIAHESGEPFPEAAYTLCEWVAKIEKELKEEIPVILKNLEGHYGP